MQVELVNEVKKRQRINAVLEPRLGGDGVSLPELPGYQMECVLGHGGMGIVYRARQTTLGRLVAVKMMSGPMSDDSCQRFRAEAQTLASLPHPHIVQVFESGQADGRLYLVMEYASGGSLAQQLRGVPLRWRQATEIAAVLAQAVQHAHQKGIIHRDLKPANVLLSVGQAFQPDGGCGVPGKDERAGPESLTYVPKVADFGLAKYLGVEGGQTVTGAVLGTPSYMAPEQAQARKDIGPACDIYALGAILYEMLTGRPPFQSDSAMQTLMLVSSQEPVPPARLNPAVPADLETVCLKCLQKAPGDRYASAGDLAGDLRRVLAGEPTLARPLSQFDHVTRALRRTRFDRRFRDWMPLSLLLSPIPAVTAVVTRALVAGRSDAALIQVVSLAVAINFAQVAVFCGNWRVLQAVPEAERSRLNAIWGGTTVAMLVMFTIVWLVTPTDQSDRLLVVLPLWLALVGVTFAAQATDAGVMYAFSGWAFTMSLVSTWLLPWAPLITGCFVSLNFILVSLFLWRMGRDGDNPPQSGERGGASHTVEQETTRSPDFQRP